MSLNTLEIKEFFEFGPFRLDTRARLLFRDGIPVPLPPKSYETLVHLVRNRGRAVSRDELFEAVWPGVVVSDGSLTQAVFLLRKALGETEDGPRFIATVPRIGYRFTGDVREAVPRVEPFDSASPEAPAPPDRREARHRVLLLAGAAALAISAYLLARSARTPAPGPAAGAAPRDPAGAAPLALKRELAVPPDATHVLGHVNRTFVLAAPGGYYLLPEDGALAATRISLGEGELLVGSTHQGIAVTREGALVIREPLKQKEKERSTLPADLPKGAAWSIAPDGRHAGLRTPFALEVLAKDASGFRRAFRVEAPSDPDDVVVMTSRYLGLAPGRGGRLRVFELATGRAALDVPFDEIRPRTLAVDDASGTVAVGGAFDAIVVFRMAGDAAPLRIPRRGWTHGLAFVPDAPTLVASGFYGLAAFREAEPLQDLPGSASRGSVTSVPEGLLVLSTARQRLSWMTYAGLPSAARVEAGAAVFWAVERDAAGASVFAGGRDGKLYALDLATRRLTEVAVHTDGIPSLLRHGDLLASASDDKTVAIWQLPDPKLVRRSTAHRFLVNDLRVADQAPAGATLVTSSSDGTLKTWSWPGLEPREAIDIEALTGKASELHALWVAPDLSRLLAGTWDGAVLDLKRRGGRWAAKRVEVPHGAVYRFAALPRLGAVAAVGIYPHGVFLYELASGHVHPLESAGLETYWCVAGGGAEDELFVVGNGGASRYVFEAPSSAGEVRYRLFTRRQSGLGLMSATLLPDRSLWTATSDGALVQLDAASLEGPWSFPLSVTLGPRRGDAEWP